MSNFYRWFAALGVAAAAAATIPAAQAQQFPNRPIELIVPYAAGGGSGITAEVMKKIITEEKLSPQPVNINYKPGASGQVGWTYLATKKGDAHTIATATASFSYGMVLKQMQVGPEHFHAHRADARRYPAHGGVPAVGFQDDAGRHQRLQENSRLGQGRRHRLGRARMPIWPR
jgi:hypothetical protein